MKRLKLIYLKNQMLAANTIADFIVILTVNTLMLHIQKASAKQTLQSPVAHWAEVLLGPFAFCFVTGMTFIYKSPRESMIELQLFLIGYQDPLIKF
jgi:hypothetical protein